ncbi:carboxymuconolactone decarboxylase family protein [Fodinicola acaciae]|uniref:carboxymuconolactone decarboxylase family protein n=1 Tax=Fodinicola acaciae TaxID=2681555 RepID=UPI0013D679D0|nr:carboxymuconolactone decarboxylase family protein [Fodinicola acaciae]
MEPRISNLAKLAGGGYQAMLQFEKYLAGTSLPATVRELVKLRASQINGCGFCVDMHAHDLKKAGESDERLFAVAAWRDAPYFTDQERAALGLAEAATRIADVGEVPDNVWNEAAAHFTEEELVELVMAIAAINAWNTINVTTRQLAGAHRRS